MGVSRSRWGAGLVVRNLALGGLWPLRGLEVKSWSILQFFIYQKPRHGKASGLVGAVLRDLGCI